MARAHDRDAPPQLSGADPAPAGLLGRAGLRDPAALRHGGRGRHLPPGHDAARARPAALGGRLRAALAAPDRRALRREPEPLPALLPVPGDREALAAGLPGPLSRLARRDRHRHGPARHPLRRGRLGEPDARRLGPRLGGLVRRHGGQPVHLLPAGRRPRLPPGLGRAHLRARAAGDVRARASTTAWTCRSTTPTRRSRSPTATSSARPSANTRAGTSRPPTPTCCCATSRTPRPNAARILEAPQPDRAGRIIVMAHPAYDQCIKAEPPLQPARRPRRDLGHRAPGLHRPGPRAGPRLRRRLARDRGRGPRGRRAQGLR